MSIRLAAFNLFRQPISQIVRISASKFATGINGGKCSVLDTGSRLEIFVPKWSKSLNFSYVWLRDHCRCEKCYDTKTSQRIQDLCSIPLNICPLAVNAGEDSLVIKWPDNHISSYNYKFLWTNIFEGSMQAVRVNKVLWSKMSFPGMENISIPLKSFRDSESGQKFLVNSILKHGIGCVSEVPPDIDSTQSTVENLFKIRKTIYGKMSVLEANSKHADLSYSTQYLEAHTDTTYLNEASRIQVFHMLQAGDGGETLLVDGFNVAAQFKDVNAEGYKFLSTVPTPAEYKGDNQHYVNTDNVIKHCPVSRRLCQIRFNISDRAPISSIPYEKVDVYYKHLQNLISIVKKQKNEVWLKLQPGQVLFVDNWRVMHGRAHFTPPRILGGCYIDEDSFSSKVRTLGFCS